MSWGLSKLNNRVSRRPKLGVELPNDIQLFLARYNDREDNPGAQDNLQFYANLVPCRPDGLLIDEIHQRWTGDYTMLEQNHSFIQWLFPIREHGVNYQAQPLRSHEIPSMAASPEITRRILASYSMILDFYGMNIQNWETGLLQRSAHYHTRYRHLCRSHHNYLRISRILKCLSELGLEKLNAGFLLHVLNEQSEHNNLNTPGLCNSMDHWWINCIRNDQERRWLNAQLVKVRNGTLVFHRKMYELALEARRSSGILSLPNVKAQTTTASN